MKRALALGTVAVLAIGAGVYFLTRPSADVELRGGYATRSWGGAQAVDPPEAGAPSRFKGNGTIAAIVQAGNPTDHPVELAAPGVRQGRGLDVSVVFLPERDSFPSVDSDADLEGATTTMPANAVGAIVHLFRVTDCSLADNLGLPKLRLEADGHPARVEISPTSDTRELALYEDEALHEDDELVFEGC